LQPELVDALEGQAFSQKQIYQPLPLSPEPIQQEVLLG